MIIWSPSITSSWPSEGGDPLEITSDQITYYRLRRSGLIDPFDSPGTCARELAGMQAQIHTASGISLWNRTCGLDLQRFEEKLYDSRSLVKIWGQRGTLHVYDSGDWPLIIGSREGKPTWWERSIVRKGGDVEGFHTIVNRVREIAGKDGIVSRSVLREHDIDWDIGVDVDLLSSWGGIFAQLVAEGTLCHVRPRGGEGRFAHRDHWMPTLKWDPPTRGEANIELLRRFLHTFGPATIQDYAYWRYAPLSEAREGVDALGNEVAKVKYGGDELLILEEDLPDLFEDPPPRTKWPVKLLYRFDPLLLGHKDKSWIIDIKHYDKVWITAGHINGTVMAGGRIQGTWNYKRRGSGKGAHLDIEVRTFRTFGQRLMRKVEREAKGVAGFFGMELGDVKWL